MSSKCANQLLTFFVCLYHIKHGFILLEFLKTSTYVERKGKIAIYVCVCVLRQLFPIHFSCNTKLKKYIQKPDILNELKRYLGIFNQPFYIFISQFNFSPSAFISHNTEFISSFSKLSEKSECWNKLTIARKVRIVRSWKLELFIIIFNS